MQLKPGANMREIDLPCSLLRPVLVLNMEPAELGLRSRHKDLLIGEGMIGGKKHLFHCLNRHLTVVLIDLKNYEPILNNYGGAPAPLAVL